jgi:hypothetical protein
MRLQEPIANPRARATYNLVGPSTLELYDPVDMAQPRGDANEQPHRGSAQPTESSSPSGRSCTLRMKPLAPPAMATSNS